MITAALDAGGDLILNAGHHAFFSDDDDDDDDDCWGFFHSDDCDWAGKFGWSGNDPGGSLLVYGSIISGEDVEIWAEEGITIEASITAVDRIEMGTDGAFTTTSSAPLASGGDIELYAREILSIGGTIHSGDDVAISGRSDLQVLGDISATDDVCIYSWADLEVAGRIAAKDRIHLTAKDDLTLWPESSLAGLDGEEARLVWLWAGDDITMDGHINAEKLIVH